MIIIIVALSTLLAGLFFFLNRRHRPTDFIVMHFGMVFIYAVSFPLARSFYEVRSWRNLGLLRDDIIMETQIYYLIYLIGIFIASMLGCMSYSKAFSAQASTEKGLELERPYFPRSKTFFVISLLLGAVLFSLYINSVGLSVLSNTSNFAAKYQTQEASGVYYFGLTLLIAAFLFAESGLRSQKAKVVVRFALLSLVLWAVFFVYIRWPAVMAAIGYATIYFNRNNFEIRKIGLRPILILFSSLFAFEFFAQYRGYTGSLSQWGGGDLMEFISIFDFGAQLGSIIGGSELIHPFITAAETALERSRSGADFGALVGHLEIVLPRIFRTPGALSEAQQFALTNYPELYARGGGTGFSIVAGCIAYLPKFFGTFLFAVLFGLLLNRLDSQIRRFPFGFAALTAPVFGYFVVGAERLGMVAFTKQILYLLVVMGAIQILSKILVARRPNVHQRSRNGYART